jgi:lipoprotein signal peptidase
MFQIAVAIVAAILVVALDQVTKIAAEQFLADTPQQSASSVRFEIVTTLTPGSGDSLFHLAQG